MNKACLFAVAMVFSFFTTWAQQPKPQPKKSKLLPSVSYQKKYPSLLWEITGKGMKQPSYLFGSMHVSNKLAFHLGDSFYNAIKSAQVVALETNPENWQDDYSNSDITKLRGGAGMDRLLRENRMNFANNKLSINAFAIDEYEEFLEAALAVEPSMINGLLYRSYGDGLNDFEEDTYLDMHIFQTGKRLGKQITSVENFQESEKLVMEGYIKMLRDRNRKKISYDYESRLANPKKLEDAYRKGDLDQLDSLEALSVSSDAFQENFLFKRNEIQANSIDTILKKNSLFVAVGAAHLPGKRGVIELLRAMGYTVKPVNMDERKSAQKEALDTIQARNVFTTQTSKDDFYQVDIPGKKFYKFTEWSGMDMLQHADMANGSYYMVTRIKSNSSFQGFSSNAVLKKIDSLLYENIPGKILKKIPVVKNGYHGWDILNRTRRGDHQRYHIYVTPFEIIIFKMSGTGEFILKGNDAQQFFSSIKLKEYKTGQWINFQPALGGFNVQLPHTPLITKNEFGGNDRIEYAAYDEANGNNYLIMKNNFHNINFVEEDTFELNLLEESYRFSSFIDRKLTQKFVTVNGYPGLESKYLHKDGSFSTVKYILRGPVYYTIAASYKKENDGVKKFKESFAITPFIYPETKTRIDTNMHFNVQSPFYPEEKKKDDLMNMMMMLQGAYGSDEEDDNVLAYAEMYDNYKVKIIGNDTTGELIYVSHYKVNDYAYVKDSALFIRNNFSDTKGEPYDGDSTFIIKMDKRENLANGMKWREMMMTDTGSSRLIHIKFFYKKGHVYSIFTVTDTLSNQSPFLSRFFSTFTPDSSLKGNSVFTRKSEQFFKEYFGTDSSLSKKAKRSLNEISYDSADAPLLKNAINRIGWKTKDYVATKVHFIGELGNLKDKSITPFLQELYVKVKDSSDFQHAILNALLAQKTKESFTAFNSLILQEPPIESSNSDYDVAQTAHIARGYGGGGYARSINGAYSQSYSGKWFQLYDTLALTKNIYPDFLQLLNIDDYKNQVIHLTKTMIDSGYLKAKDYETYFTKFYLDAKQLLKKQVAKEENEKIEKESLKNKKNYEEADYVSYAEKGNSQLENYSILMLPFYEKNPSIPAFFEQLLKSNYNSLQFHTALLLLRNNRPVPDSLFNKLAGADEYRFELYKALKKIKQLHKFPSRFNNQAAMSRSILVAFNNNDYTKPDSLTYLDKMPVTYKNKKGWIYFYKYKEARDDSQWKIASVGMQPEKETEIDTENDLFTSTEEGILDTKKPVKEQLAVIVKEMLITKRESASEFYEGRRYNIYKNYLSQMVKTRRYSD
jgi:uncharacterized protein YbaP (TraB family)